MNREVLVKLVATGTGGRGQVVEITSLALLFKTPFDIITCGEVNQRSKIHHEVSKVVVQTRSFLARMCTGRQVGLQFLEGTKVRTSLIATR